MIYAAYIEDDGPDGMTLVLEGDMGTSQFPIGDEGCEALDKALNPWRLHQLEGEIVRREFVASGGISWDEYRASQERTDPDWSEGLRETADLLRKRSWESLLPPLVDRDPADETSAA